MKRLALATALVLVSLPAFAGGKTYVKGYFTQSGTYVQPHYRSTADSSRVNNWSSQGNYNPYTGQQGTINPYAQPNPYTNQYNNYYQNLYAPTNTGR